MKKPSKGTICEIPLSKAFARLKFPRALNDRLTYLLDLQDQRGKLSASERREAEALVEMADLLTLLRLNAMATARSRKSV